jgi:hypothetical protein
VFTLTDIGGRPGPLVLDAIRKIVSYDEREGQEDMTIIGEQYVTIDRTQ